MSVKSYHKGSNMTETEFIKCADSVMKRIESAIDASEADIDCEIIGGGVLELEFENGSKIIVNRQGATQEVWVAAKSGGFHFRWKDGEWRDTRDDSELFSALRKLVALQAGITITFD
jgi:CyaY protein